MTAVLVAVITLLAAPAPGLQEQALGIWELTTQSPEGTFVSTLEIRRDGDRLVAIGRGDRGERPYDSVAVDGSRITMVVSIDYNGMALTITFSGEIKGGEMSGGADFGGLASGTWSATRK